MFPNVDNNSRDRDERSRLHKNMIVMTSYTVSNMNFKLVAVHYSTM